MNANDDQYRTSANLDARVRFHRRYTPPGADMMDAIWGHYRFDPGQRVLETGCGSGSFWTWPDAHANGIDLVLSDRSSGMVDEARRVLAGVARPAQFCRANAEALPFADQSFDVVLSHFMLYHVTDKPGALAEFARVARDWVGIVLLNAGSMARITDLAMTVDRQLDIPPGEAEQFNASRAAGLLADAFTAVTPLDYRCTLRVTDAADVVAYAQSSDWAKRQPPTFWSRYEAAVQADIDTRGAFEVTKACTLFVCRP